MFHKKYPVTKAIALSLSSLLILIQACPNPANIQGYLGNEGTDEGNCDPTPLPPLVAFGSLTINQNPPLQSVNRLNPTQLPTTNNFQLFQNPCAIDQNTWSNTGTTGIPAGAGTFRMRHGPFLIGMARTGPVATVSQYNFNKVADLPNLSADARMTFFFSATEANQASNPYFSVSTNVVNSDTCVLTYTPNNPSAAGIIRDYNLTGNVFHDVYYENLTPALAFSGALSSATGAGILLSIDGGMVQEYTYGSTVSGTYFQFFADRYTLLGPATMVLYAVNAADTGISFTLPTGTGDYFIFTAAAPYTGFLRLAPISTNDAAPAVGNTWSQMSFFMPEDICNDADTSVPASIPCMKGTPISTCAIEDPACTTLVPTLPNWWNTAQVHAIAPSGMSYYLLYPSAWANSFTSLAFKTIRGTWMNTVGTTQYPTSQALSEFLQVISMFNPSLANTYYSDFFSAFNPSGMMPFTDGSDYSTNFFVLQFDMFMANNVAANAATFQTAHRSIPSYTLIPGVNNVAVYTAHRKYIPVQANISTTSTSISWSYTASTDVPPPAGPFTPIVCFPFWKSLQGATTGMLNLAPGPGEPLQNYIFNDTIKGTLYAAECINGAVTFLEGEIPPWYGSPSYFIPSGLTFSMFQNNQLATALIQIQHEIFPLPSFPESHLDAAYDGLKTCYMLAKSALYISYYMAQNGSSPLAIVTQTQPFIDNAKSCLTAYLLGRTPGSTFFIADRAVGGICVNGAGGNGTWASGPNLQQYVDSGRDFGNYVYNDHHYFAGYFLQASAMVTEWELTYSPSSLWINLAVTGADYGTSRTYKIRDMIDFLWRDTHNPFTNDATQPIYDPDLPYDRYGLPWEGHSVANGLQYLPNALGRNQESLAEDFNCWLGMNSYAGLVLKTALTGPEMIKYQAVYDFSLMNMKLTGTGGIQWYKNTNFWKGVNMYDTSPTFLGPCIFIGQFTQATVTNGNVNDQSQQNQTYF